MSKETTHVLLFKSQPKRQRNNIKKMNNNNNWMANKTAMKKNKNFQTTKKKMLNKIQISKHIFHNTFSSSSSSFLVFRFFFLSSSAPPHPPPPRRSCSSSLSPSASSCFHFCFHTLVSVHFYFIWSLSLLFRLLLFSSIFTLMLEHRVCILFTKYLYLSSDNDDFLSSENNIHVVDVYTHASKRSSSHHLPKTPCHIEIE